MTSPIVDAEVLPSYTVSSPPPCYSSNLACGEQCIQHTPRCGSRPSGTFTKQSGGVTVVLMEQHNDATIPMYGRHGIVHGVVSLDHREIVSDVRVKLEGRMRVLIPGGGSRTIELVHDLQSLWSYNPATDLDAICPSTLPFSCAFPTTFEDRGVKHNIPPSFDLSCLGPSGLIASIDYSLQVKVIKGRHRGIGLWVKVKKIRIPIKYVPRSRPPRPIVGDPDLFSDLKISPEEWHQTLSTVPSRSPGTVSPINCNFFVPSSKVFSFGDVIPFHIQLSGPLNSLRDLSQTGPKSAASPPIVRVHLLRQISLDIEGQKAWRNTTLSHGKVWSIPPPMSTITDPTGSREESLDWEGEINVPDNVCPSFSVGDMAVKDFLVLTIIPSNLQRSSLTNHQSSVSTRLVTDSWIEEPSS
ncbi:hypothetical protein VNI00_014864 [Paramarasmius palmivorus]|uniref:Arrestin-like N-terminal domain-containing protein n=1 Tax=Paramarasmius palmivorus TaxID=297713 RepID=A0AAW0BQE3_9AGAR